MGVYDVDAMLAAMSSRMIAEWMAYYSIEPFGDELIDIHFAKLDAIMASSKDKKFEPDVFRVWRDKPKEDFDPQAFFDGLKAVSVKK